MVDFGSKLKQLRIDKGLSQPQLAERIGISKGMISAYENTSRYPSNDILIKIARVFRVSTDYLLGVERNKTIDISKLNDKQTEIITKLVDEFK